MTRMQQRRKTATNWTTSNEVLLDGEIGLESNTGKWKVGDGTTAWTSLAYQPSAAGITAAITAAVNDLIGGAPGALDTLNELAAAINDDASYASAVTAALAAKASTSDVTAAQAYAIQRGNHTGTQPAGTVAGLADFDDPTWLPSGALLQTYESPPGVHHLAWVDPDSDLGLVDGSWIAGDGSHAAGLINIADESSINAVTAGTDTSPPSAITASILKLVLDSRLVASGIAGLETVAITGNYSDLGGLPTVIDGNG